MEDLFAGAARRLRRRVPFDAAVWLATDPATHLPCGPARLDGFDNSACLHAWELELLGDDVNTFRELRRAAVPAATLGADVARSRRHREVLAPAGLGDELRAVLRVGGTAWGVLTLMRERPGFTAAEVELVAELSAPLAEALREHARRPVKPAAGVARPAMMLFAPGGTPLAADEHATALLAEFGELAPAITLVAARAVAERRTPGPARIRARSSAGRWLACHASCLRDDAGAIAGTALAIEPAAAPEIAAIAVRAHALTGREHQVARLIARGCSTADIACRLHLSTHTVRDYVKAIFGKLGVSTRGELVARLMGDVG